MIKQKYMTKCKYYFQPLFGGIKVIQLKDGVAICDLVGVKADEVSLYESIIATELSFVCK